MSEPVYVSRSSVVKVKGAHRQATLSEGTTMEIGVHGAIKAAYGLDAEPDLPLAVDYVVAAAGG